jgi:hypothetical protein
MMLLLNVIFQVFFILPEFWEVLLLKLIFLGFWEVLVIFVLFLGFLGVLLFIVSK